MNRFDGVEYIAKGCVKWGTNCFNVFEVKVPV